MPNRIYNRKNIAPAIHTAMITHLSVLKRSRYVIKYTITSLTHTKSYAKQQLYITTLEQQFQNHDPNHPPLAVNFTRRSVLKLHIFSKSIYKYV